MLNKTYHGDSLEVLKTFPDNFIDCCVTSPPYFGLRDYGVSGQIGLEKTPEEYVSKIVLVFSEVRRVLKPAGTLWLNIGDSYLQQQGKGFNGNKRLDEQDRNITSKIKRPVWLKPKDLIGIPWMLAFALRGSGWWLRQDIIWHKPNPMPESVTDRCTKAHEYIFLLSKSARYYYDAEAIKEDFVSEPTALRDKRNEGYGAAFLTPLGAGLRNGYEKGKRNKRSVWSVTSSPFPEAHFATFPPELIVDCIKAGCPADGIVLDPFNGSGTTRIVAEKLGRNSIGIELNPKYIQIENRRRKKELGMFEKIAS